MHFKAAAPYMLFLDVAQAAMLDAIAVPVLSQQERFAAVNGNACKGKSALTNVALGCPSGCSA